jgi:3-dehydroquinate dehydratase-2
MDILILNGPNLNLLGQREVSIYGSTTFSDYFNQLLEKHNSDVNLTYFQSNAEHELINKIHAWDGFIVFNPAAFTHTSIALRDALLGKQTTFVEVHISNVYLRESFRHHSYFSDVASAVIVGAGLAGYDMAIQHLLLNY